MLADYINEKNISLYSISKKSNIPYSTLNDIANGKVDIDNCKVSVLVKLAKVLGMSLEETYEICCGNSFAVNVKPYDIDVTIAVKNKKYYIDFEYNGITVEQEVCKVNEISRYYIDQIAKWRVEDYVMEKNMEAWNERMYIDEKK